MLHFETTRNILPARPAVLKGGRGGIGNSLAMALIFTSIVLVLSLAIFDFTQQNTRTASKRVNEQAALRIAEAGIEKAVWCLNNPSNVTDCPGNPDYPGESGVQVGNGTFTTTVSGSSGSKTVDATGTVKGSGGTSSKQLRVVLGKSTSEVAFHYGVQVGEGGIVLSENAKIIGNVYSNGSVIGANGATIDGEAIIAGTAVESVQARSTVCNQDQIVGQVIPEIDFAQSFNAPASEPLSKISLYLKKVGNPPNRTVRIAADAAGSPATTQLGSGTLSRDLVTASYGWIDVVLSAPVTLTQNATYWIILDAADDASNYWVWCKDQNNGYGNGLGKYSENWDKKPWTQINGDLNFKTYFGSGVSYLDSTVVTGTARANSITNSKVCGDAYYQTIDPSSLSFVNTPANPPCPNPLTNGTAYPGSADPALGLMPVSDANVEQWKIEAQEGEPISGDYTVTDNVSLGPKEITGNLIMNVNNKTLTVTGTIYVHGNIDISNGSAIRCSPNYGTDSCILLADGWIHITNNGVFQGSGQAGSYVMLLSTLACTGVASPSCTGHHYGATDIHNNATGVIFYATKGMINLHNNVGITEATAYKLQLDNNAVITYEQGLVDARFSAGPGAAWTYQRGSYRIL